MEPQCGHAAPTGTRFRQEVQAMLTVGGTEGSAVSEGRPACSW
jgi:hypothetical protein